MAIAIGTNSTTSPRQSVSLTSVYVSATDVTDIVESMATLETPFIANTSIVSNPVNQFIPAPVANPPTSVTAYNQDDIVESLTTLETPFIANTSIASNPVNQFIPAPVANPPTSVTAYNQDDMVESISITKTPFTLQVPYAWSTIVTGGYSGVDTVITEYADEYWITQ